MADESTRLRLTRVAEPVLNELGIKAIWAIAGDQKNTRWQLKVWSDPMVEFDLDHRRSDAQIADGIRVRLRKK